jgi:hypothetical protein
MKPADRSQAPAVLVKHRLGLAAVERAIREWEILDPGEVQRWRDSCKVLGELYAGTGGWSQTRELLAGKCWPSYVQFRTAQLLRKLGWDMEEARMWDRAPNGRDDSELFKLATKLLLPEAEVTRKEQRQRSHRGVGV